MTEVYCRKGHLLSGRNVFIHDGYVKCRKCKNEAQRALRKRNAEKIPQCPHCGQKMKPKK